MNQDGLKKDRRGGLPREKLFHYGHIAHDSEQAARELLDSRAAS